jgi:4'-phosphopantetheinyl transferase
MYWLAEKDRLQPSGTLGRKWLETGHLGGQLWRRFRPRNPTMALPSLSLPRCLLRRYAGPMRAVSSFELSENTVYIWSFPTKASPHVVATFERVLIPEERDRAFRFRFHHLYASFVIAHGALRHLLGRYLNCDPAKVPLVYSLKGKPAVEPPSSLQFNMTHSGDLAVIALTLRREIGVDVEQIRPLPDMQQIADSFFCPEEASEVMSFPQTERERAFFLCWTRKEAYIKATGDGLSAPLDSFRVTIHPDSPARFLHVQHDETEAQAWTLHDLQVAVGYAAALAYRDQPRSLRLSSVADPDEFLLVS